MAATRRRLPPPRPLPPLPLLAMGSSRPAPMAPPLRSPQQGLRATRARAPTARLPPRSRRSSGASRRPLLRSPQLRRMAPLQATPLLPPPSRLPTRLPARSSSSRATQHSRPTALPLLAAARGAVPLRHAQPQAPVALWQPKPATTLVPPSQQLQPRAMALVMLPRWAGKRIQGGANQGVAGAGVAGMFGTSGVPSAVPRFSSTLPAPCCLPLYLGLQAGGQQASRPGYGSGPGAGGAAGGYSGRPSAPSQPGGYGASPSRPGPPGGYGGSAQTGGAGAGGRYGQATVSAPYREQQRPSSMPGFTPAGQVRGLGALRSRLRWFGALVHRSVRRTTNPHWLAPACGSLNTNAAPTHPHAAERAAAAARARLLNPAAQAPGRRAAARGAPAPAAAWRSPHRAGLRLKHAPPALPPPLSLLPCCPPGLAA